MLRKVLRLLIERGVTVYRNFYERALYDEQRTNEDRETFTRSLLRRFPYWREGHRNLGSLSLTMRAIPTAYASGLALRQLGDQDGSEWLLGQCALRTGDAASAAKTFEDLLKKRPRWMGVREELAAAYMSLDRCDDALKEIESIPTNKRTPEASSAYALLRQRAERREPTA